jgi:folate-binding protein YgfZ
MSSSLPDRLATTGAIIDLSDSVRLRFTGNDRLRYLNGQLTCDVRKASPDTVLPGCVTNHKGRLEAVVSLHSRGDAICLDAPASLADFLPARLGKYIIADDVELEDISAASALLHCCGGNPDSLRRHLGEGETALANARFGPPGTDIWCPPSRVAFWLSLAPPLSREEASTLRIQHGWPDWDADLGDGILPPEAGLDATHIDYHKGCYIGQEVLSRMRTAGKLNQRLVPIRLCGPAVAPGTTLLRTTPDGSTTLAGKVSSLCPDPDGPAGTWLGLAWLRKDSGEGPWTCPHDGQSPLTSAAAR